MASVALGDMDLHFCVAGVALGDMDLHFCVAGVALGDMDLHFAWQSWRFETWTFSLRGRRGTNGAGLPLVARLVPSRRRCRLLAWQAWHLGDKDLPLRGRRGAWRHGPSLCMAGVALGDIDLHFTWKAALGDMDLHLSSLCMATVALMALSCLWWRVWFPVDAVVVATVGVAGVPLGDVDLDLHFAWQAWRLATYTFTLRGAGVALGDMDLHFRVAGVALGDMDLHFCLLGTFLPDPESYALS